MHVSGRAQGPICGLEAAPLGDIVSACVTLPAQAQMRCKGTSICCKARGGRRPADSDCVGRHVMPTLPTRRFSALQARARQRRGVLPMIVSPLASPRGCVDPKPAFAAPAGEGAHRRVRSRPESCVGLLLAALTVSSGCASRRVPQHFPEQAAASPAARAAPPARVTQALAADLPLPGEPGAEALDPHPQGAAAPQSQHGAHHHGQ